MARVALPLIAVIALGAGGRPGGGRPWRRLPGRERHPQDPDARAGACSPSSRQRTLVTNQGAKAKWNRFGTPRSLTKAGRYLAIGLPADLAAVARTWIGENSDLLGLTGAATDDLARRRGADRRGPGGAPAPALRRPRGGARRPDRGGREARKGRLCHLLARPLRQSPRGAEGRRPRTRCAQRRREAGIDAGTLTGERTSDGLDRLRRRLADASRTRTARGGSDTHRRRAPVLGDVTDRQQRRARRLLLLRRRRDGQGPDPREPGRPGGQPRPGRWA